MKQNFKCLHNTLDRERPIAANSQLRFGIRSRKHLLVYYGQNRNVYTSQRGVYSKFRSTKHHILESAAPLAPESAVSLICFRGEDGDRADFPKPNGFNSFGNTQCGNALARCTER